MTDHLITQFIEEETNSWRFQLNIYHEYCLENGIPAIQMKETHVAQFLKSFIKKEIKETYLHALNMFYIWCKNQGLINYVPTKNIVIKVGTKRELDRMSMQGIFCV